MIKIKKAEEMQSIYRMHSPTIKTEFGNRSMTEIGVIKNLEVDEVVNYILVPNRVKDKDGKEKTLSWEIHKLTKECEVDVVSWDNLD